MSIFSGFHDEASVWAKGSSLFNTTSRLNDLLDSNQFTLEQLLQQDDIIQEVKTRNEKLLEFLSQEHIILQLVEYVTKPAQNPQDDIQVLKYPYVSCEVLCCDIMSITDILATASDGKIVSVFLEFLDLPAPLNPRLCGYFEKIFSMLMVRKPQEITKLINQNAQFVLQGFITHVRSYSVAEIFKRLLQPFHMDFVDDSMEYSGFPMGASSTIPWYSSLDEEDGSVGTPTASSKALVWHQDTTVIDLLVSNLAPLAADGTPFDSDAHKHTADILVDLTHFVARSQLNDPSSPTSDAGGQSTSTLMEYLESEEIVEKIISYAIPTETLSITATSSMTASLSVLSALLSFHTNARYTNGKPLPIVLEAILNRLPQICATLRGEMYEPGFIYNQRHEKVPRLGLGRLRLVGLLVLLTQTKFYQVDAALLKEKAVEACLDLFFAFESVNILHSDVENMVVGILDGGSKDLLIALIREGRLLPRLLQAFTDNEQKLKEPKPFALGCMGHIHRICRVLLSLMNAIRNGSNEGSTTLNDMTHADSVADLLEEDVPVWKAWDTLAATKLEILYEEERHPLGGVPLSFETVEASYNSLKYTQEDQMRAQFAEMLSNSEYITKEDNYEDDYGLKDSGEASMLPEILNDSSSSEDDDDFLQPHRLPSDDDHKVETDGETPNLNEDVDSNWANFEENPWPSTTTDEAETIKQTAEESKVDTEESIEEISYTTEATE